MSITVRLPALLREYTDHQPSLEIESASNLSEVLQALGKMNSEMKARILNEKGDIQPYLNVFINNSECESMGGLNASLKDGDEIYIISSIAGG